MNNVSMENKQINVAERYKKIKNKVMKKLYLCFIYFLIYMSGAIPAGEGWTLFQTLCFVIPLSIVVGFLFVCYENITKKESKHGTEKN